MEDIFGEMIYSYSREQALLDEVLFDVSEAANKCGFALPTCVSANLKALLGDGDYKRDLQTLLLASAVTVRDSDPDEPLTVMRNYMISGQRYDILIDFGLDDVGAPCFTLMLREDL